MPSLLFGPKVRALATEPKLSPFWSRFKPADGVPIKIRANKTPPAIPVDIRRYDRIRASTDTGRGREHKAAAAVVGQHRERAMAARADQIHLAIAVDIRRHHRIGIAAHA